MSAYDFERWERGGVCPTLNAFDNATETRATVIAFYATGGGNDAPAQDISPTIKVGGSLGIPSPPAVVITFSHTQGLDIQASETVTPTLRTEGGGMAAMISKPVKTQSDGQMIVAPTLSASNNPSRSPQSAEVTAQVEAMHAATSAVRRLTPRECEALQGFPSDWTAGQADSHRYKQMGNAVTVNVARYIAFLINTQVRESA